MSPDALDEAGHSLSGASGLMKLGIRCAPFADMERIRVHDLRHLAATRRRLAYDLTEERFGCLVFTPELCKRCWGIARSVSHWKPIVTCSPHYTRTQPTEWTRYLIGEIIYFTQ